MVRFARTALTLAVALSQALPATAAQQPTFAELIDKAGLVPPGAPATDVQAKVSEAIGYLKRMDLPHAHQAINAALQLDDRNSYLHLLNGFIYHLEARQGDTPKTDMAIEGYQQALRLDPSNWIAEEFLGQAYVDLKQFRRAKAAFADVLMMTPDSRASQFGLMATAYLTGDPRTACAMADQYRKSPEAASRSFIRSSIAVYGSCANFTQADQMRQSLAQLDGNTGPDLARADRRLAQWKAFYVRQEGDNQAGAGAQPRLVLTAAADAPESKEQESEEDRQADLEDAAADKANKAFEAAEAAKSNASGAPGAPNLPNTPGAVNAAAIGKDGPRMLMLDAVLLSTQDVATTSKGVNLLNALTLELGNAADSATAGFSYVRGPTSNTDYSGVTTTNTTTAITRAVSIPALTYSLNIANANSTVNEVLSRPTLAAVEGQQSDFFAGTNLSAGLVSTSQQGGTTIVPLDKRFGIKLAVTPTFLSEGRVLLKVEVQRTSLDATVENAKAAYEINIGETTANANVVMKLGETLILSGLNEKSSTTTHDGVPGLQGLPIVQYFFSKHTTDDIRRSVLVLITPRAPSKLAQDPTVQDDDASRMKALRERFGFKAGIASDVDAIIHDLQPNELFREFRQGDVSLERWDHTRSTVDRLKEALGFIYY